MREIIITPKKFICSEYERTHLSLFRWIFIIPGQSGEDNRRNYIINFRAIPTEYLSNMDIAGDLDFLYNILNRILKKQEYVRHTNWILIEPEGSVRLENVIIKNIKKEPKNNSIIIGIESDKYRRG